MIRMASLLLASALIVAAAPALAAAISPAPLAAPTLRPAVTVDAPVIRLGDLFTNAGRDANDVVAAAPAVGTHMTFAADWLAATAREHHLAWTPRSAFDEATVGRATRVVGADAVVRRLMAAIAAVQPVGGAELELDNPALRLMVAADAPDTIGIDGLEVDPRSGRISAFVSAPAGAPNAARQRVTGRLIYWENVPVLVRPVAPGMTISADDITTIKVRRDLSAQDLATDPADLIGKTPRRPLPANQPIELIDVRRPILVHRGDLVTVELKTARLELTAQGKALEDGAMNALVRVENTKSNRVIDAAVAGPGEVAVVLPGVSLTPAQTASR